MSNLELWTARAYRASFDFVAFFSIKTCRFCRLYRLSDFFLKSSFDFVDFRIFGIFSENVCRFGRF